MGTPRQNDNPPFTKHVVEQGILKGYPFGLVDVGASGGIESHWLVFKDYLVAVGFEPLVAEVARLNALSPIPSITYHAMLVTSPEKVAGPAPRHGREEGLFGDNRTFARTSAVRAMNIQKMDYVREVFDPSGEGFLTEERTTLDLFTSQRPDLDMDFIKIDTDGADYDVLLGAAELLARKPVLGLFIESQFHGPIGHDANLFCNIDRFLRDRGFSLFDLEVYRYSRATLPKRFVYPITAQTLGGQVLWGDALYLRDAAHSQYVDMWGPGLSSHKLLKLACLFELYGLEDCAAELLCNKQDVFKALLDVDHCLDLLTPPWRDEKMSFRTYNARFETHLSEWFPKVDDPTRLQRAVRRMIRFLDRWA